MTDRVSGERLADVRVIGNGIVYKGPAGDYRFDQVPLGANNSPREVNLRFDKDGYWFVNATAVVTGELLPDGTCRPHETTVDVALLPVAPAFVSGQVVEGTVDPPDFDTVLASTTPVEGAQVCAFANDGGSCATTQADGRYPATSGAELSFLLQDNDPANAGLGVQDLGPLTCNTYSLLNRCTYRHGYWTTQQGLAYPLGTVQPGQHLHKDVALVRQCTTSLEGTVTDTATGGPAANVRVDAFVVGLDGEAVATDAHGHFSMPELLLGVNNRPVTYLVAAGNGPLSQVLLDHCGAPATVVNLTVTSPATGGITGRVVDQEDHDVLIGGALVGQPGNSPGGSVINCPPCGTTNIEGHYTLDGVLVGPTAVTADHPDYWPPEQPTPVEVTAGTPVTAPDIFLLHRRFAAIEGAVTDQTTGQPIDGANVSDAFYGFPSDRTRFLPASWDSMGCQSWDHPARLAAGSLALLVDCPRVMSMDAEVVEGGTHGGQRG